MAGGDDGTAGPAAAAAPSRPEYRRILSNRSFLALWSGQLVSQSGDFILGIALLWLVLLLTGSAFYTGLTAAAELAPAVVVAPLAGVYVDRLDRRDLLVATMTLQGATVVLLAVLFVVHWLTIAEILVLVFVLNALAQFPRAAVPTLLPRMVGKDDLMAANGLFTMSTSTNQLLSLSIGGAVIALLGVAVPIYYDAATFFLAAVVTLFIARSFTAPLPPTGGTAPSPDFVREFWEGWGYLRSDRLILELMALGLAVNTFGGILLGLLAPYVRFVLGASAAVFGLLLAALAVGSLVGALLLGRFPVRRHVGSLLFGGVAALGALIGAMGLLRSAVPAYPLFFAVGLAIVAANLPIAALPQARIPAPLQGRANATLAAVVGFPQPIGAALAGSLTRIASIGAILLAAGLSVLVLAASLYVVLPNLRVASY